MITDKMIELSTEVIDNHCTIDLDKTLNNMENIIKTVVFEHIECDYEIWFQYGSSGMDKLSNIPEETKSTASFLIINDELYIHFAEARICDHTNEDKHWKIAKRILLEFDNIDDKLIWAISQ